MKCIVLIIILFNVHVKCAHRGYVINIIPIVCVYKYIKYLNIGDRLVCLDIVFSTIEVS